MATLGCNLQVILSVGTILTKSDVKKFIFDLVTLTYIFGASTIARELKPNLEDHVEAPGNHKHHEGVQDGAMDESVISDRETNKWEVDV